MVLVSILYHKISVTISNKHQNLVAELATEYYPRKQW